MIRRQAFPKARIPRICHSSKSHFHSGSYRPTTSISYTKPVNVNSFEYLWRLFTSPSHLMFLSGNTAMALVIGIATKRYCTLARQRHERLMEEYSNEVVGEIEELISNEHDFDSIQEMGDVLGGAKFQDISTERYLLILSYKLLESVAAEINICELLNATSNSSNQLSQELDSETLTLLVELLLPVFNDSKIEGFGDFIKNIDERAKRELLTRMHHDRYALSADEYHKLWKSYDIESCIDHNLYYYNQEYNFKDYEKKIDDIFRLYNSEVKKESNDDKNARFKLVFRIMKFFLAKKEMPFSVDVLSLLMNRFKMCKLHNYEHIIYTILHTSPHKQFLYPELIASTITETNKPAFLKYVRVLELDKTSSQPPQPSEMISSLLPISMHSTYPSIPTQDPDIEKDQNQLFGKATNLGYKVPLGKDEGTTPLIANLLLGCIKYSTYDLVDLVITKLIHNTIISNDGHKYLMLHEAPESMKVINQLNKTNFQQLFTTDILQLLLQITCETQDYARLNWILPHIDQYIENRKHEFKPDGISKHLDLRIYNEKMPRRQARKESTDVKFIKQLYSTLLLFKMDHTIPKYDKYLHFDKTVFELRRERASRVLKVREQINKKGIKPNLENHNDLFFISNTNAHNI